MAFCTSCGAYMNDGNLFCEQCGARQDAPTAQPASVGAPTQQAAPPAGYGQPGYGSSSYGQPAAPAAPRKPLPPGLKIALIAVAAVVILVALFSFVMGKINAPEKTISAFVESIMAQDFESFSSVTVLTDEELELTEETVAPFFALYHDRIGSLEGFQEALSSDLALLERDKASLGNGRVRLVEHNKILFKTYEVELSSVEIAFVSNLSDTQVNVGGKSLTLDEANTEYSLQLLPGLYDVTATHTNELLNESFSTELTDCELSQNDGTWYLNLEYGTLHLRDIGLEVSSLTVNGVDYGPVDFNGSSEFAIFPLPQDVEIVVTYNVDGVTLSDSYAWTGGYCWDTFYPEPSISEDTAREMLDQVGASLRSILAAYSSSNLAALESMPAYGKSSVLNSFHNELENSLNLDARYRYVYYYTLREMEGDLNWNRRSGYDPLSFTTTLYLGLNYTYDRYYRGELQTSTTGEPPEVYEKNDMLSVSLQRIDGQWVVSDLDWAYGSRSNINNPYVM